MPELRRSHRLVLVTGKGGVGRSLIAAALARLSAAAGLRTVLVTPDTRDEQHPYLGIPLAYQPKAAPGGFHAARVDAFSAIEDYARRHLPLAPVYKGLFRSRSFRDFAAATPGFDELMCLGRLYNLATEGSFDRVIFDGPATGHFRALVRVPGTVQRAVRVGPLNHNARKIEDLLFDPDRTQVVVTALPEEMALREALELVALCREELRMRLGHIVVNRRVRARFGHAELAALEELEQDGSGISEALRAAVRAARGERTLDDAQDEALALLREAGLPILEVPRLVLPVHDPKVLLEGVSGHVRPLLGAAG
jgi:anion-transporting  ArsA/GET3 family ATPase